MSMVVPPFIGASEEPCGSQQLGKPAELNIPSSENVAYPQYSCLPKNQIILDLHNRRSSRDGVVYRLEAIRAIFKDFWTLIPHLPLFV
jgi:hypothetical protein